MNASLVTSAFFISPVRPADGNEAISSVVPRVVLAPPTHPPPPLLPYDLVRDLVSRIKTFANETQELALSVGCHQSSRFAPDDLPLPSPTSTSKLTKRCPDRAANSRPFFFFFLSLLFFRSTSFENCGKLFGSWDRSISLRFLSKVRFGDKSVSLIDGVVDTIRWERIMEIE